MTTRPALILVRKTIAAVAVSFIAATTLGGATVATSSAHDDSGSVVSATKEWKSKTTVDVQRTKEW